MNKNCRESLMHLVEYPVVLNSKLLLFLERFWQMLKVCELKDWLKNTKTTKKKQPLGIFYKKLLLKILQYS